jgi:hypothetical protein
MMLSGLAYFTLIPSGQQQQPATSKKQEKKLQQMKPTKSGGIMTWNQVSPALLERLEMTEDFDLLVCQLGFDRHAGCSHSSCTRYCSHNTALRSLQSQQLR